MPHVTGSRFVDGVGHIIPCKFTLHSCHSFRVLIWWAIPAQIAVIQWVQWKSFFKGAFKRLSVSGVRLLKVQPELSLKVIYVGEIRICSGQNRAP